MNSAHQELGAGKWFSISFLEQMANIGSEVERAIKWKNKGNIDFFQLAFARAIELLDFSLSDKKNNARLKEFARIREALADYFLFDNQYGSSDEKWRRYFYSFNYAARKNS